MVGKIRDFVDRFRLVVCLAGDDDLGRLLTDLFEDLIHTLLEEVGGIGALGQGGLAVFKQGVKRIKREGVEVFTLEDGCGEAGARACVAGGAVLFDKHGQRVTVTVGGDRNDVLVVAAGFPLEPKLLTGAAVEAGKPLFHRDLQAFAIHIGDGQHLARDGVHHHGGNQALFVKFEFINVQHRITSQ